MGLYRSFRPFAAAGALAGVLAACGGGSHSETTASNVMQLSSGANSETIARYNAAFGTVGGPGIATMFSTVAESFLDTATATVTGTTPSTACFGGGTAVVTTANAAATGLQAGETATVTFSQCKGLLGAPGISDAAAVTGAVNFQVQAVQGTVGDDAQNWSYTAVESANALTFVTATGTTTYTSSVTYTTTHDAATGLTTTTASTPVVTLGRTQAATSSTSAVTGGVEVDNLAYTLVTPNNSATSTLTASATVTVRASDSITGFIVATPTPVTLTGGAITSGIVQLTTSDATATVTSGTGEALVISVSAAGRTVSYAETIGDLEAVVGG